MSIVELAPTLTTGGWLAPGGAVVHRPSPNCDDRPAGDQPSLLVVHAISLPAGHFTDAGSPLYIEDLFLNRLDLRAHPDFAQLQGVRVSAHFLILRDGRLIQFVGADRRAWHAGRSQFMGRSACNDFSIGVELEGSDFVPFTEAQYRMLTALTGLLCAHYPICHIVGHQDIAPDRKTDPGPFFDWPLYQKKLQLQFPLVLANATMRDHAGG